MIQAHIFFKGIVQGVGFRYTFLQNTQALKLTGWVKNLDDGRVEAVIEGEQEDIERLCKKLDEHFEGSIQNKEITYLEASGVFKAFQIIHS